MQRVFDFSPAEHEIVVSRILLQVHQAVDEAFPHARPASQRFAKTAFIGSDEPTLTQIPVEPLKDAVSGADGSGESLHENASRGFWSRGRDRLEIDAENESRKSALEEGTRWAGRDNASLKQTLIGVLTLILVALVAYLILTF